MLLEHRKKQSETAEEESELSDVFMKTRQHTEKFSRYKNRETIASVRRLVMVLFIIPNQSHTDAYLHLIN